MEKFEFWGDESELVAEKIIPHNSFPSVVAIMCAGFKKPHLKMIVEADDWDDAAKKLHEFNKWPEYRPGRYDHVD